MGSSSRNIKALFVVSLCAVSGFAYAQTATSSNTIVANVQRIISDTEAGKDMNAKLVGISRRISDDLTPEGLAIEAEARRLEQTPAAQLQSDQFRTQRDTLNRRAQAYLAAKSRATADIQATREDALNKYQTALDPIVKAVVAQRGATLLLDSAIATFASPSIDVTNDIITRMNASTRTIAVVRKSSVAPGAPTVTPVPPAKAPPPPRRKR